MLCKRLVRLTNAKYKCFMSLFVENEKENSDFSVVTVDSIHSIFTQPQLITVFLNNSFQKDIKMNGPDVYF